MGSNAVKPVICGAEVAARIPHHWYFEWPEYFQDVLSEAIRVNKVLVWIIRIIYIYPMPRFHQSRGPRPPARLEKEQEGSGVCTNNRSTVEFFGLSCSACWQVSSEKAQAIPLRCLKAVVELFSTNQQSHPLVYDSVWAVSYLLLAIHLVIREKTSENTFYNDHYFRHAYWTHIAALIAYMDPARGKATAEWANSLVKDACSSVDDAESSL